MNWQTATIFQVIVGSLVTIFARKISLSVKKVFFGIGTVSFLAIAVAGLFYSTVHRGSLPEWPSAQAWPYIFIEGLSIPAAWFITYKTIKIMGASNAAIINILNMLSSAVFGIVFLHDGYSPKLILGALLIIISAFISLNIAPDEEHKSINNIKLLYILILVGAIMFGLGMYAEKMAVSKIGVWNYAVFGWGMQAIGALILFIIFGREEVKYFNKEIIKKGILLGLMTSVAGGLYVYALSKGSLSNTIIASSGKIAITVFLAAVLLKERNDLIIRLFAFILAILGIWLVVK